MGVSKALAGLAAVALSHAVAAQLPPAAVFGSLPAMESPAISAAGDRLAFIAHSGVDSFILVANLDGMQVTSAVQVNEGKLRSVFWANDEALVFTASTSDSASYLPGAIETAAPYGVDLSGEATVTRLLKGRTGAGRGGVTIAGASFFATSGAQLIGWERSTGNVLYPKTEVPDFERVLYSIDPKTDRQRVVDRGSRFTRQWIVDESGEPIYRVDYTQKLDQYTLLSRGRNRWEVLVEETIAIPEMSVYGLDASDRLIVRARPAGTDYFGLYELAADNGEIGEAVLVSDRYDVAGARIDPYTNRVAGSWIADDGPVWFDAELGNHQELLDEAFPGESVEILSWSRDRTRFLVRVESSERPPAYYHYDASEPSVAQIGTAYAGLQGLKLPGRRAYSYMARDGETIPAFLTLPVDSGEPAPLVVLPHGGPAARDYSGFDWMAHFLATRGYAVLQPNFRGSGGFGKDWEEAGHGQWGIGVMQHDLSDGVAALIEAGVADADRVCIVGASYGGYAALAGAAFTPELYRCAAAIAPVSDLVEMLGFEETRRGTVSATVSYWRKAMGGGDPDDLNDRLSAASPADHAQNVKAPVLLIHGRDDSVVPITQSRTMERELQAAGKIVDFVELDGEDHWLSVGRTRIATLEAIEEFLAQHLGQ